MENSNNNHDVSESSSGGADQIVEAMDLLEESWFFENLFTRRTRMLRCYSDPCTSSKFSQAVLAKDSCSDQSSKSAKKLQDKGSGLIHGSLVQENKSDHRGRSKFNRQLSLQVSRTSCTERILETQEKKTDRKNKSSERSSQSKLLRAPSLPTSIGMEDLVEDNESDIRMSRLILQALADSSEIIPPRPSPNKAMGQSCSMQRCRPARNLGVETNNNNNNTNGVQESRRRCSNQKILQKCHSDLAFQELQGFKDLGFTFDKEDWKQDKVRRPYLYGAWHVQSRAPPIPNCVSKNSAEDMKAQLKFWARAVATNVRQEC
ncbi:hypothetical protein PTKIN_Ptkin14bG0151700 [Pterospermum kingtungense]